MITAGASSPMLYLFVLIGLVVSVDRWNDRRKCRNAERNELRRAARRSA